MRRRCEIRPAHHLPRVRGGQWGAASDGQQAYFGIASVTRGHVTDAIARSEARNFRPDRFDDAGAFNAGNAGHDARPDVGRDAGITARRRARPKTPEKVEPMRDQTWLRAKSSNNE